jgi:hypothetical protein
LNGGYKGARHLLQGTGLYTNGGAISGIPVQGGVSVVEADPYYPSSSDDAARGDNLAYLDEDGSVQLVGLKDIPTDKLPAWKKQARSSGKAPSTLPRAPPWQAVVGTALGFMGLALAIAAAVVFNKWRRQRHAERMAAMARQLEITGFNEDEDDVPELRAYKVKGAALAEMGLVEKQKLAPPPPAPGTGIAALSASKAAGLAATPRGVISASTATTASTQPANPETTNPSTTDDGPGVEAEVVVEPSSRSAADIILEEALSPNSRRRNSVLRVKQHQAFNAWFTEPSGAPRSLQPKTYMDGSQAAETITRSSSNSSDVVPPQQPSSASAASQPAEASGLGGSAGSSRAASFEQLVRSNSSEGLQPGTPARRGGLNYKRVARRVSLAVTAASRFSEDSLQSPAAGGWIRKQGGEVSEGMAAAGDAPVNPVNTTTSSTSSSLGSSIRSSWLGGKPVVPQSVVPGAGQTRLGGVSSAWALRNSTAGEATILGPHPRLASARSAAQKELQAAVADVVGEQAGAGQEDGGATPIGRPQKALHFDLEGTGGQLPADLPGSPAAAASVTQRRPSQYLW